MPGKNSETNRQRKERLKAACKSRPTAKPSPNPVAKPMGVSVEWLIGLADFGQIEEIKKFVHRQDWAGLKKWVKRVAAPAVSAEFESRAWPPPPRMFNGLPPDMADPFKNTFQAIQNGGRWITLEQAAAEEAERKRKEELEQFEYFEPEWEW